MVWLRRRGVMGETLYKWLDHDGKPGNRGTGVWNRHGKWMPAITGTLIPCSNGYHLYREQDLVYWILPELWQATYRGERVDYGDKVVVREARLVRRIKTWTERTARLLACDCTARVLPIFEAERPDDMRPRQTIETARRYAAGQATRAELDAAVAAARAAWAAWAAGAAGWAAVAAAVAAVWAAGAAVAAARAAAWAAWAAGAARAAERKWQEERLLEYVRHGVDVEPWPLAPATGADSGDS